MVRISIVKIIIQTKTIALLISYGNIINIRKIIMQMKKFIFEKYKLKLILNNLKNERGNCRR